MTLPHETSNIIDLASEMARKQDQGIEKMVNLTIQSMQIALDDGHELIYYILRVALLELQSLDGKAKSN